MKELTLAIDVMGGDYGPRLLVPAVKRALVICENLNFRLYGQESVVNEILRKENLINNSRIIFESTTEVVENEDKPIYALRHKRNSSMWKAIESVADKESFGVVSGGNTGALVAMSNHLLGNVENVRRSALVKIIPSTNEKGTVMLDLGANINVDEHTLYQYGIMGSILSSQLLQIARPRVAILNIGTEEIKGTPAIRKAYEYLSQNSNINFVGYIEGNDIFTNEVDVIVTDGFVGNVALKTAEGLYRVLQKKIQGNGGNNIFFKIIKHFIKRKIGLFQPDHYNGSSLLGINGIVVKSHGNANEVAFFRAIEQAYLLHTKQIPELIANGMVR